MQPTIADEFQLELLYLKADVKLTSAFKSNQLLECWSHIPEGKYLNLIANAHWHGSVFGSTYACEALFNTLVSIKTKYRNWLTDDYINIFHNEYCIFGNEFLL